MNPVHWIFFTGTAAVSLGFALYAGWVFWRYRAPAYRTAVTGCEIARFVLDQAGLFHIAVTPIRPSAEYASMEGLFLEPRVYEGHDFLSVLQAARQAFLKSQLSNVVFWARLKKRVAFLTQFLVLAGWTALALGNFIPALRFFVNLGLGCFCVVMFLAVLDTPFELDIEEKTSLLLKNCGHFQPNERLHLKKLNRAVALEGLGCLFRSPFSGHRGVRKKKETSYEL